MEEIAKLAGVSKATVSRVLNDAAEGVSLETRKRVLKIAQEQNYSLNKRGARVPDSRCKNIALILPDISNPFFADITKAVENTARQRGYTVVVSNTGFSEESEIRRLQDLVLKKVEGIILVPCGSRAKPEHLLPEKFKIPLVLMDRKLEGQDRYPGVYSNNEYAAVVSCETLIKHKSRRIAFITGAGEVSTSRERLEGYKAVLAQHGISFDPALCKHGNYTVESGYNAVMELERSGTKYSAILAANDLMALGSLKAVTELGYKVPEEIEIIGFDNILFSQYCEPPLSTIQQPTDEMGRKAVELLFQLIDEEPVVEPERLVPRLLLRKTTR